MHFHGVFHVRFHVGLHFSPPVDRFRFHGFHGSFHGASVRQHWRQIFLIHTISAAHPPYFRPRRPAPRFRPRRFFPRLSCSAALPAGCPALWFHRLWFHPNASSVPDTVQWKFLPNILLICAYRKVNFYHLQGTVKKPRYQFTVWYRGVIGG